MHQNYFLNRITSCRTCASLVIALLDFDSTYIICIEIFEEGLPIFFTLYGMAINRLLIAMFIAPRIHQFHNSITVSEVIGKFYGHYGYITSSVVTTFFSLIGISIQIFAFEHLINFFFDIPLWWAIIFTFFLSIYTTFGGIKLVSYLENFHFLFIICAMITYVLVVLLNINLVTLEYLIEKTTQSINIDGNQFIRYLSLWIIYIIAPLDPTSIHRLLASFNSKQAVSASIHASYIAFFYVTSIGFISLSIRYFVLGKESDITLVESINNFIPSILKIIIICLFIAAIIASAAADLSIIGISLTKDITMRYLKINWKNKTQILCYRITIIIVALISFGISNNFDKIERFSILLMNFWVSSILITFIFILYGKIYSIKVFLTGIIGSIIITLLWNIVLLDITQLPGVLIGSTFHISFLTFSKSTYQMQETVIGIDRKKY